jgi:outer membrane receptor for ferrienterochelin and colicin
MIELRWAATALLALPVPLAAQAQTPNAAVPAAGAAATSAPTSDRLVYEAAFFSAFSPQTALDMISRLPGFTLDDGDSRRGFAGAAGNVLIDGARPSAKSQSLGEVLSQIAARQVERIEVLRNPGRDAQGQAVVANVVRVRKDGSGVWRAEADLSSDGRITPIGEGSINTRVAGVELKAGLSR